MPSAREQREAVYREHNITRPQGLRSDALINAETQGVSGMLQAKPAPCELRCQCDDCRRVARESQRTLANDRGER